MLRVNNTQVVYNDVILVLKGISLEVPENGIVSLLGANGAGKTTTLKFINGIIQTQNGELEEGDIDFKGESILDFPHFSEQERKLHLRLSPSDFQVGTVV